MLNKMINRINWITNETNCSSPVHVVDVVVSAEFVFAVHTGGVLSQRLQTERYKVRLLDLVVPVAALQTAIHAIRVRRILVERVEIFNC